MLKKIGITKLGYNDIKYDIDGWADAKRFLPEPLDLVSIRTDDRTINGWYTGSKWFGVRLKSDDRVLYWKKRKEIY